MKKIIIFIVAILIAGFGIFYFATDTLKPTEILNDKESSKLANESYLDILVDMVEYDSDHVEKYKLLEVAMRIARELDLVKSKSDPMYLEYVPKDTVHTIIEELTGIKLDEPIREEDFYYLYDDENDYYYIVPIGTDWIHYGKIFNVSKKGNSFLIDCNGVCSDYNGGEEIVYAHMQVKLSKRNDYKYIKYHLENISAGERVIHDNVAEMHEYSLHDAIIKYYSFAPQDYEKTILLAFTMDSTKDENRENVLNLANQLANYYEKNSDACRNTRVVIVPYESMDVEVLKNFTIFLDVESVVELQMNENQLVGAASLAEIFEEEMNLVYKGNFDENQSGTFAFWAYQNGAEALLVQFAGGDNSLDNLVNALDKII